MRKDRTQLQVDVFAKQIERMADAYMDFEVAVVEEGGLPSSCAIPAPAEVQEISDVFVVDMFCTAFVSFVKQKSLTGRDFAAAAHEDLCLVAGNVYVASACVHRGWMPVSPFIPTVVITICALEVYRVAWLCCP